MDFAGVAANNTAEDGVQRCMKGVKGFSWFMFAPKFDIIRGVAIDYMHGTLLGVAKMLLRLWLQKSNSKEPWSVSGRQTEIDSWYMSIKPSSCITRLPRSLIANFGKSSELRLLLLFYSVPFGILPEKYFQHFILLVEGIYLLLQESISLADLNKACALLKYVCIMIKELYGARYETFNFHCLLHLSERVYDLGPFWTHSCFFYEDFNGELHQLFRGTRNIDEQILLAVSIHQKIPQLIPLLQEGSLPKKLYESINH